MKYIEEIWAKMAQKALQGFDASLVGATKTLAGHSEVKDA